MPLRPKSPPCVRHVLVAEVGPFPTVGLWVATLPACLLLGHTPSAAPAKPYISISTETGNSFSAGRSRRATSDAHNCSLTSVTDPVSSSQMAQKRYRG